MIRLVDSAISQKIDPSLTYVRSKFRGEVIFNQVEPEGNFFNQLELFIEDSKPRVTTGVINEYKSFRNHLKLFKAQTRYDLNFRSINYDFYQKFRKYLQYDVVKPDGETGLAVNTIGKQFKNLKVFLRYCMKKGTTPYIDLSDIKTEQEEVENIYLDEDEINKIAQLDLSKYPTLEVCRDLFIIGCETGLRFSDFSELKPAHIKGAFIWKRIRKTHHQVVIPISKLLQEVLHKYQNAPPNNLPNQVFNRYIKKVGDIAGIHDEVIMVRKKGNTKVEEKYYKYELITSHTCRRSFCTNQFYKGMPSLLIRKISGHRTESSFLKYIKINEEAAARKMLEYWNQESA